MTDRKKFLLYRTLSWKGFPHFVYLANKLLEFRYGVVRPFRPEVNAKEVEQDLREKNYEVSVERIG